MKTDTLLNVFLAIAVDNLTNAEILSHDEEAAETKRIEQNLRKAFELDNELNQNALSFVTNLQAKALSMREEEENDDKKDEGRKEEQDDDDAANEQQEKEDKNESDQDINNEHMNDITSAISLVLQNGNSAPNMKPRKSISVFDKVLLNVPETPKQNDIISYLSPKKTP